MSHNIRPPLPYSDMTGKPFFNIIKNNGRLTPFRPPSRPMLALTALIYEPDIGSWTPVF